MVPSIRMRPESGLRWTSHLLLYKLWDHLIIFINFCFPNNLSWFLQRFAHTNRGLPNLDEEAPPLTTRPAPIRRPSPRQPLHSPASPIVRPQATHPAKLNNRRWKMPIHTPFICMSFFLPWSHLKLGKIQSIKFAEQIPLPCHYHCLNLWNPPIQEGLQTNVVIWLLVVWAMLASLSDQLTSGLHLSDFDESIWIQDGHSSKVVEQWATWSSQNVAIWKIQM